MASSEQSDSLIKKYLQLLNLDVMNFQKIVHEESISSSIYKLTLKDKKKLILKVSFDEKRFQREKFFLNELINYIPVPKIIETIAPSKELNGAILMEYLDGDIITLEKFTKDVAFQMGELLAKLHLIKVNYYGDFTDKLYPPNLESGKLILKNYFEESFNECKNVLDKKLLNQAQRFFYDKLDIIKNLDGPVVAHRDFKPGNVIYKNNKILGLIDFEIAKYSFSEEDFSQMEYLVWEIDKTRKKDFFNGYSNIRKLPNLDIMPILRLTKALGAIGFTIVRKTYKNEHKFIFEKNLSFLEIFFNLKNNYY